MNYTDLKSTDLIRLAIVGRGTITFPAQEEPHSITLQGWPLDDASSDAPHAVWSLSCATCGAVGALSHLLVAVERARAHSAVAGDVGHLDA